VNLTQLIKDSHKLAVEKGWWSLPEDTAESKLLMIHGKISEAAECYRNGEMETHFKMPAPPLDEYEDTSGRKPLGFPIAVADIAIGCADLLGDLGCSGLDSRGTSLLYDEATPDEYTSVVQLLLETHDGANLYEDSIVETIEMCRRLALKVGFDLDEAIRIKLAYDRIQPGMHVR